MLYKFFIDSYLGSPHAALLKKIHYHNYTIMTTKDYTLDLVRTALDELDQRDCRLSVVARKALRIARLRNDWEAVYWLQMELEGFSDKNAAKRQMSEVAPYLSREAFERIREQALEASFASRSITVLDSRGEIDDDKISGLGIQEIEENLLVWSRSEDPLPSNLAPLDVAVFSDQRHKSRNLHQHIEAEQRKVLARIAQRVHSYLSQVERQLVLGQLQSDVFEDNRRYVDQKLQQFAPKILEQLQIAYRRTREGTVEARSHALTSCRRALKALADRLYPPSKTPVKGADGKERILNDSLYVARLLQFISESKTGNSARRMLTDDLDRLGKQVDRLNELAAKGVHAEVTEFEVNMCVLSLYNVAGAILRLHDETSGAAMENADLTGSN